MKDRIKAIRKEAGLNQTEFAASLGLSRGFIAQVETDQERFSDRSVRDICRIYRVNEEWLRTGAGPMRPELSRNQQIAEFVNEAMAGADDDIRAVILYAMTELDVDDWAALTRIIEKIKKPE